MTARYDTGPILELLGQLPVEYGSDVRALQNGLAATRATFGVSVLSRAREYVTTVLVVDTDASGVAMPERNTAEGVLEMLSAAGFLIAPADVSAEVIAGRSAHETLALLQSVVSSRIERAVVGTATIAEFAEREGFLVRVTGSLTVVDLNTGTIIGTVSGVRNAQSSSASQAIRSAFLSLGRLLGRELASTLP